MNIVIEIVYVIKGDKLCFNYCVSILIIKILKLENCLINIIYLIRDIDIFFFL